MTDPRSLLPWQRPPFAPGNAAALRHGAYSPRRVDPLAAELVERLAGDVDYLRSEPAFAAAVWGWARAEARVQLVSEYVDEHGLLDPKGKPRAAADLLVRLERLASEARSRLGLDPLSRARLGRDVSAGAFDLARLWMEQDEAAGAAEGAQDGSKREARE
jgi:hypothetical protein